MTTSRRLPIGSIVTCDDASGSRARPVCVFRDDFLLSGRKVLEGVLEGVVTTFRACEGLLQFGQVRSRFLT